MTGIPELVEIFARAGGGGSGGGGGGSGGGGGDIIGFIIALGYGAGSGTTKLIRRFLPGTYAKLLSIIAMVVWMAGAYLFLGLASSSNSNNNAIAFGVAALFVLGLWLGWHSVWYHWLRRSNSIIQRAKFAMQNAAAKDITWDPETLRIWTANVFNQFQQDWSKFDTENMKLYLKPPYDQHMNLVLRALAEMGRQNIVEEPRIIEMYPIGVLDRDDDEQDVYSMEIHAAARDMLIDSTTGQMIYKDVSQFTEVWNFEREGDKWMLTGINQSTAREDQRDLEIMQLAMQNNMFYSLDWGWLLLPKRGQLFSEGQFGVSDINNHVIGLYDNLLVQLYTYEPRSGSGNKRYVIGQINLPRNYGSIIVRRRPSVIRRAVDRLLLSNYADYSMEWPDFNRRYQVLATDPDRLATFELVNPAFMAYLYDLDANISIEVVDSVVYFYTQDVTTAQTYQKFLGLLTRAYKELRL